METANFMIDNHRGLTDIIPIFTGYEVCESRHTFGPYIRDHYIIHVCLRGKGTITDTRGEHAVKKGEFFIIRPGEVTVYSADESDPWVYVWIAFKGSYAEVLREGETVYACSDELAERIYGTVRSGSSDSDIYTAFVYELISAALQGEKPVKDVFSKIKRYICYKYMEDVSVESLARAFGFERSYLYRMFMKKYGIGVKEFIIKTRMEKARTFLLSGYSVAHTAYMVGYKDEFNFSRAFKKYYGTPPSACRSLDTEK